MCLYIYIYIYIYMLSVHILLTAVLIGVIFCCAFTSTMGALLDPLLYK